MVTDLTVTDPTSLDVRIPVHCRLYSINMSSMDGYVYGFFALSPPPSPSASRLMNRNRYRSRGGQKSIARPMIGTSQLEHTDVMIQVSAQLHSVLCLHVPSLHSLPCL